MQQAYPDPNASLHGLFALLAALWSQKKTGKGRHIDLSQMETGVSVMGEALMELQLEGRVPGTNDLLPRDQAPCGNYPVQGEDKWVSIAVRSDDEFRSLCAVMSRPDLAVDDCFSTMEGRRLHRGEL